MSEHKFIFKKNYNACIGAYLYSEGTQHWNRIHCNEKQDDLFYSAGPHRDQR